MPNYERGSRRDIAFTAAETRNHTIDWPLPLYGNVKYPPQGFVNSPDIWELPRAKVPTVDPNYSTILFELPTYGNVVYPPRGNVSTTGAWEVPKAKQVTVDPDFSTILWDVWMLGGVPAQLPPGLGADIWDLPVARKPTVDPNYATILFELPTFGNVTYLPRGLLWQLWELPVGRKPTVGTDTWPLGLPLYGNVLYPPQGLLWQLWELPRGRIPNTDAGYPSNQLPDVLTQSAPAFLPPGFAASWEIPKGKLWTPDPNYPSILWDLSTFGNVTYPPQGNLWQLWELPRGKQPTIGTDTRPWPLAIYEAPPASLPTGALYVTWDLPKAPARPDLGGYPTVLYDLPLFGSVVYPPRGLLGQMWDLPQRAVVRVGGEYPTMLFDLSIFGTPSGVVVVRFMLLGIGP